MITETELHDELTDEYKILSMLERDLQRHYGNPEAMESINEDIHRTEVRITRINNSLRALHQ